MSRFENFFFNNYKAIFHIIGLLIYYVFITLFGLTNELRDPVFVALILTANYFTSKFSLKWSGLDKMADDYKTKNKQI